MLSRQATASPSNDQRKDHSSSGGSARIPRGSMILAGAGGGCASPDTPRGRAEAGLNSGSAPNNHARETGLTDESGTAKTALAIDTAFGW